MRVQLMCIWDGIIREIADAVRDGEPALAAITESLESMDMLGAAMHTLKDLVVSGKVKLSTEEGLLGPTLWADIADRGAYQTMWDVGFVFGVDGVWHKKTQYDGTDDEAVGWLGAASPASPVAPAKAKAKPEMSNVVNLFGGKR